MLTLLGLKIAQNAFIQGIFDFSMLTLDEKQKNISNFVFFLIKKE